MSAPVVFDVTTPEFREAVLVRSMEIPVLVDFWAPWCGPCKQLGPSIEKVVKAAKGKIALAKMNIDEYPEVAQQLGVQSIPAVYAFQKGQPIDGFVGNLPESQIKGFIERLTGPLGADIAELLVQAEAKLEAQDSLGAVEDFSAVLAEEPGNAQALAGMARVEILNDNLEAARALLASVSGEAATAPAITGALAALELAEQAAALGDAGALTKAIEANPLDFQARFDLALILNAKNQREEAVDQLIAILRKKRDWQNSEGTEESARKQLLTFFEAWGPMDEATLYGRRQLSATLFS
jgi:putative thioredoxin